MSTDKTKHRLSRIACAALVAVVVFVWVMFVTGCVGSPGPWPHLSGGVKWKVDTSKMGWVARFFWVFPYLFGK